MHVFEKDLRAGIQTLGLVLTDAQVAQLLAYMDLIQKWTKVYNLTAVRDPAEMLTHHLLDSLAVVAPLQKQLNAMAEAGAAHSASVASGGETVRFAQVKEEPAQRAGDTEQNALFPHRAVSGERNPQDLVGVQHEDGGGRFAPCPPLAAQAPPLPAQNAHPHPPAAVGNLTAHSSLVGTPVRLLDVGSGAGLPGAVIAICLPHVTVHCVDTVAKKAAFIQQVAVTLKLPNLRGIHARVENLTDTYDVVSSRAFASLVDFVTWSQKALAGQGVWMAMKGKHPADEMAVLPSFAQVFHVEQLSVPGLDAERCIVWMRPPSTTA